VNRYTKQGAELDTMRLERDMLRRELYQARAALEVSTTLPGGGKYDHAALMRIVELAGDIMQMCNEMLECPFCGGDDEQEGEHDRECICHALDVALGGPHSWCDCALCAAATTL